MAAIPDPLDCNFNDLSINDFIVELHHKADKAEVHPAFQNQVPEYVTKAAGLRELADKLGKARDAAAAHDRVKTEEKKALWAAGKLALSMSANHIVMISLVRNDPTVLDNCGYDRKEKSSKQALNILDLCPEVFAKHGGASGCIIVMVKRAKSTVSIELQITDQDPAIESAWSGLGIHTKSRIELRDQEPAKKISLRSRYHVDGNAGKWSTPTTIIVL